MSWKDRIEYLKQGQQEQQEKRGTERLTEENRIKEEQRRYLGILERLSCSKMLTEIRDEIWQIGEVHTGVSTRQENRYGSEEEMKWSPIGGFTPIEEGMAFVELSIEKWPYYREDVPYANMGGHKNPRVAWRQIKPLKITAFKNSKGKDTLKIESTETIEVRRCGSHDTFKHREFVAFPETFFIPTDNLEEVKNQLAADCFRRRSVLPYREQVVLDVKELVGFSKNNAREIQGIEDFEDWLSKHPTIYNSAK